MICYICKQKFETEKSLHSHISRKHKTLIAHYYQEYFPRYDLLTNELIDFKNKTQYFAADFNNRNNFNEWLEIADILDVKKYFYSRLQDRIVCKDLKFVPCQVELRSLLLPNIEQIEKIDGIIPYANFCYERGCQIRFDYDTFLKFGFEVDKLYVDSREKKPLNFSKIKTEIRGLNAGDYTAPKSNIVIERKSVYDLVGTLSSGLERFEKEIKRARKNKKYLVVLVEYPYTKCLHYRPLSKFGQKVGGNFVFNKVRYLLQKYDNIQFLFVRDRKEAAGYIIKTLELGDLTPQIDLQYIYDKGGF